MRISTGPVAPTHHSMVPVQNKAKTTAPHLSGVVGFIFMAQLRRQIPGVIMNKALACHREQHHAVGTAASHACDVTMASMRWLHLSWAAADGARSWVAATTSARARRK